MAKDETLRPDIAAAKALLPSTLGSGREIKKLESHLWEGETVERMVAGTYGRGNGLLTLTDRRILFTLDGMVSTASEDFPLEKVSSIQWESGLGFGSITIFASGNKAKIQNVNKSAGKAFVELVRDRLNAPTASAAPASPAPTSAADDIPAQIRKLGELRDAGILTEEEFSAKKAELLRRL